MARNKGFTQRDFATFHISGLEARMKAIQERIQPKFRTIGSQLCAELSVMTGREMFLHIARHARRTVNPPNDTWLAVCDNKRGYKQHPHFQMGLFDDHVFIWLAYIYELPDKGRIAQTLLESAGAWRTGIPGDFVVSADHMRKDASRLEDLNDEALRGVLERFRDVKKCEFLIGRHIPAGDPVLGNGDELLRLTVDTFKKLMPLYQLTTDVAEGAPSS